MAWESFRRRPWHRCAGLARVCGSPSTNWKKLKQLSEPLGHLRFDNFKTNLHIIKMTSLPVAIDFPCTLLTVRMENHGKVWEYRLISLSKYLPYQYLAANAEVESRNFAWKKPISLSYIIQQDISCEFCCDVSFIVYNTIISPITSCVHRRRVFRAMGARPSPEVKNFGCWGDRTL